MNDSKRIEEYALLSDCHGCALVAQNGDIDWLVLPRFDSASAFSALIGTKNDGRWTLAPAEPVVSAQRAYIPGTMIMQTTLTIANGGSLQITDAMIIGNGHARRLVRRVRASENMVFRSIFQPLFEYGQAVPWTRHETGSIIAMSGPDALLLQSECRWDKTASGWQTDCTLRAGEERDFVLSWFPSHLPPPAAIDVNAALESTATWWKDWAAQGTYEGPHRELVERSLLTLKALTYAPTGAIVAAPTTSLPEFIGGIRNWDYRYCWLRDATFTILAFLHSGYHEEAQSFVLWLMRAIAGKPADLQILYGVAGERRVDEWEILALAGYENSRPVRIGNAAYTQLQLDVFGEVMDAVYQAIVSGVEVHESWTEMVLGIVDFVRGHGFHQPDEGMWEIRGEPQYFVESQVMVWVVLDRAVALAERGALKGNLDVWRQERASLHAEIVERGFSTERNTFVQSYGSRELDANLLMLPLVGFLPIDDPKIIATVTAIEKELLAFPLVRRYSTESEKNSDGLPPGEGAFLACSFWLCDVYGMQGRDDEANALFQALTAYCNDVGLLSEEYDITNKRLLGNFPQAFSHLALVNAAHNINKTRGPAQQRAVRKG